MEVKDKLETSSLIEDFIGPKSVCTCGHSGDGMKSDHQDRFGAGHGACKVCKCAQFTWKGWTDEFRSLMLDATKEGGSNGA